MSKILKDIDADDAKHGKFSVIEGKWSVSYKNGASWVYTISDSGEAVVSGSPDRDGLKGYARSTREATIFEKCVPQGGTLNLERYWANDFPKTMHVAGTAIIKP